ncbi:MAG: glucuronate isomerase, partial [Alphaproteobacteria bacterium]
MLLDDDRLFDAEPKARGVARELYNEIKGLPLVSPHGHTDPRWYAENLPFPDPAQLLIVPDHYIFRMLFSQGIRLEDLGVPTADGSAVETDGRKIWRLFAANYHLFRGTPTRMWLDHTLETLFGITERLTPATADAAYDRIAECLGKPEFLPRSLYEQFNIEVISTTDSA